MSNTLRGLLLGSPFLLRLRRAASVLLERDRWRPGPDSASGAATTDQGFTYGLDRFSAFQGSLAVAGWIFRPDTGIAALDLVLPDGTEHAIAEIGLPSDDIAAVHGAAARDARFAGVIPLGDITLAEVAASALQVRARDGSTTHLTSLGKPPSTDQAHAVSSRFQAMLRDAPDGRFLEVGSRARSGNVNRGMIPPGWSYTGLDVREGPNVDVVGDAHRLSSLFPAETFDAVMAISVLEHLLMPWKFAVELNRVLKPGGLAFFLTHQAWPLHEDPWDYWRFSNTAWAGIFNEATGFEVVATGLGERLYLVAERLHANTAFGNMHTAWGASTVLIRRIGAARVDWDVALEDVVRTDYPH